MSIAIIRSHTSSYMTKSFLTEEKSELESLGPKYYSSIEQYKGEEDQIILITNSQTPINELPLEVLKKTQVVVHPNSGMDNFPEGWGKIHGIPIIQGNIIRAQAVTEYILGRLFHAFQNLENQQKWDPKRQWDRPLLRDLSYIIIGHGEIGQRVEQNLITLGAQHIDIHDPYKDLEVNFKNSYDALIICAELSPSSRNLINEKWLNLLNENSVVINAARGEILQKEALYHFLETHPLSKAYLDVFPSEPANLNEWSHPQVYLSSHIAGVYKTLNQDILNFEKHVVKAWSGLDTEDEIDLHE